MLCKNVDQEAIKPWLTSVAWNMPASQVVNFMIAYAEFVFLINFNDKNTGCYNQNYRSFK